VLKESSIPERCKEDQFRSVAKKINSGALQRRSIPERCKEDQFRSVASSVQLRSVAREVLLRSVARVVQLQSINKEFNSGAKVSYSKMFEGQYDESS